MLLPTGSPRSLAHPSFSWLAVRICGRGPDSYSHVCDITELMIIGTKTVMLSSSLHHQSILCICTIALKTKVVICCFENQFLTPMWGVHVFAIIGKFDWAQGCVSVVHTIILCWLICRQELLRVCRLSVFVRDYYQCVCFFGVEIAAILAGCLGPY